LQPQLNAIGGIYIDNDDLLVFERHGELLAYSTAEHLKEIIRLRKKLVDQQTRFEEVKEYLDFEKMESALSDELYDVHLKLQEQVEANELATKRIVDLEHELDKPWWKRIFS
jgi:hypothetical protein